MVGHISPTTIMLLRSTCILRFIYCNKQGQTPLRMRIDGFLQMVGHISPTIIMLLRSACILHFIYCNKQGQTPLRMRIDGFCRWWDTYLQPQSCCYGPHVYYAIQYCFFKPKKESKERPCTCFYTLNNPFVILPFVFFYACAAWDILLMGNYPLMQILLLTERLSPIFGGSGNERRHLESH